MRTLKNYLFLLALILVAIPSEAEGQNHSTETFVIGRTGFFTESGKTTYRYTEVFQARGRWIFPDVGYIDFGGARQYRETFIGAGATLVSSKHLTVIEEGYIDQASGPASGGALYFQPWTYVGYSITPKIGGEVVYFPYLPLNKAGRIQHVLERAKMEYDFKHWKLGAGYAAYQFGENKWQNKPFITTTLKAGKLGNFEIWLQKMPTGTAQVQVRYAKVFR